MNIEFKISKKPVLYEAAIRFLEKKLNKSKKEVENKQKQEQQER